MLLTKSKYLAGMQCHKLLWKLIHDKESMGELSSDAIHRMEEGTRVGILATKRYPDGVTIPSEDFAENLRLTKEYLKKDVPIFEAGIIIGDIFARVDILKPNKDGSFDIIEVKSGTSVKDENIHDVSFQKYCLEKAGVKINRCKLCHLNTDYFLEEELDVNRLFIEEDITAEVEEIEGVEERIKEMLEVIKLKNFPEEDIGSHCLKPYVCAFKNECWKHMPKNNVFDLYNARGKGEELYKQGIISIKNIPPDFKLNAKQEIQRKCEVSGEVHVQPSEIKKFIDELEYPLYYLDFETISPIIPKFKGTKPYHRIPFQFSLHVEEEDGTIKHIMFLAEGKEDPRIEFAKRLKEVLGKEGSIIVFNDVFEKGVIKELARDFPEYKSWAVKVLARVVDLLKPFRDFHYYNRVERGSASIKKVLPAISDLSYDDMEINNGGDASYQFYRTMFEEGISEEEVKRIREALEKYCELDTWAEVVILRELKKLIK